jgi:hypothetical protein
MRALHACVHAHATCARTANAMLTRTPQTLSTRPCAAHAASMQAVRTSATPHQRGFGRTRPTITRQLPVAVGLVGQFRGRGPAEPPLTRPVARIACQVPPRPGVLPGGACAGVRIPARVGAGADLGEAPPARCAAAVLGAATRERLTRPASQSSTCCSGTLPGKILLFNLASAMVHGNAFFVRSLAITELPVFVHEWPPLVTKVTPPELLHDLECRIGCETGRGPPGLRFSHGAVQCPGR